MSPDSSSVLRTVLKVVGSVLVTYGVMDGGGAAELVNMLEIVIGALVTVIAAIWSWWAKRAASKEAKQIAAAVIVSEVPIKAEIEAAVQVKGVP